MSSRFSYKAQVDKLSAECFKLNLRSHQLKTMLNMCIQVAVYSARHDSKRWESEVIAQDMMDLRDALQEWVDRGGGQPTLELSSLVDKLTGTGTLR